MLLFAVLVPVAFAYGQDEDHTVMLQRKIKINITKEVENYAEAAVDEKSQGDVQDNMEHSAIFWESRFCKSPTGDFSEVKDVYEKPATEKKERVQRVLEQADACAKRGLEDIVSVDDCKDATGSNRPLIIRGEGIREYPTGCIKFRWGRGFALNPPPPCPCPGQDEFCIETNVDIPDGCHDQCSMEKCARYILAPAGTNCPESTQIRDEEECKDAAAFLFPNPDDYAYVGETFTHWPNAPGGCFLQNNVGHDMPSYVRMNKGGMNLDEDRIGSVWHGICKPVQVVERLPASAFCGGCPSQADYCSGKEDIAPECEDVCHFACAVQAL